MCLIDENIEDVTNPEIVISDPASVLTIDDFPLKFLQGSARGHAPCSGSSTHALAFILR